MPTSSEQRLLRYTLADFDATKQTTRSTQAAAAQRDLTRANQLVSNLTTDVGSQNQQAAADLQSGAITQDAYNAQVLNGRNLLSSQLPTLTANVQTQQQNLGTSNVNNGQATNAGVLAQNQLAGQNVVYNPATGSVQPVTKIPTLQDKRQAEIASIPTTIDRVVGTDKNGNPIYQTVTDPDYQSKVNAVKTRHATEDATQATNQQIAQTKLAGSNAGAAKSAATIPSGPETALSLLAGQSPEAGAIYQALAPQLAGLQGDIEEQKRLGRTSYDALTEAYSTVDQKLATMEADVSSFAEKTQGILDTIKAQNDKAITSQQKAAEERLQWNRLQQTRQLEDEKRKAVDRSVAELALRGGFGSSAGIQQIEQTRMQYDKAISDVQMEFGIQSTELAAKFTSIFTEASNNYLSNTLTNLKDARAEISKISMQRATNEVTKVAEQRKIITDMLTAVSGSRKEYNTTLTNVIKEMNNAIRQKKADEISSENAAMEKIEYLLKTYPSASVADAIRELGKDVKSFNVETLINNPTLAELEKAKKAVAKSSGSSFAGSFLPASMVAPPKPSMSFDDFTKGKLSDMEQKQFMTFTPQKRAELLAKNDEAWKKEYDAAYMDVIRSMTAGNARQELAQQFGDGVVQAAQLVLDGTYTGTDPIGKASKALGVSSAQVATAVTKLRQSGAVADTSVLSAGQQKGWDSLRGDIEKDTFYSVYKGATSAVTRIQSAIGDNGSADGVSDIMAINAFQNGIVDPGATVREGDVVLMQSAAAWADRVKLSYLKEKVIDGDKLPPEVRQKMLELAKATAAAYQRDFQTITLPKFKQEVQQKGLPQSVLDQYQPKGAKTTTVSPNVSSFVDSLPF